MYERNCRYFFVDAHHAQTRRTRLGAHESSPSTSAMQFTDIIIKPKLPVYLTQKVKKKKSKSLNFLAKPPIYSKCC